MLMIEGRKMSKSKGNFVTLRSAIDQFGADPTRCALLLCAEDMDDPDWRKNNICDVKGKLQALHALAQTIVSEVEDESKGQLEDCLKRYFQKKPE